MISSACRWMPINGRESLSLRIIAAGQPIVQQIRKKSVTGNGSEFRPVGFTRVIALAQSPRYC